MASVSWNALEGMLVVRTPYNPEFVQELKAAIPSYERKFNPTDKTWLVGVQQIGPLVGLLMRYWGPPNLGDFLPPSVHGALSEYAEKQDGEWLRVFEEAAMAATSKAEVIYAWGFPSRREGPSAVNYEVLLRKDGTLSCNCPGWVFNKLRVCTHINNLVDQALAVQKNQNVWGGSTWMGDLAQAPRLTGTATLEAARKLRRRYVNREG